MTTRNRDVRARMHQVATNTWMLTATVIVAFLLTQQHGALGVDDGCPTVTCPEPCPQGQYTALNDEGCETCNCYDPCASVECEVGECHWRLDRQTDRPAPFCVECDGGRQWLECGGGEECIPTCSNTMPMCPRDCYSGCYCPPDLPVWHHGACITDDDCRDNCDGDQLWTDCGSAKTLTCDDPRPDSASTACVPRCQCPTDRPVWDDQRQMCINAGECIAHWKRLV